ncbi:MAG TPA: methionine aminotransferase [Saprospiraceae bacterium]|nr:methionine aminotransferase [Saprospiraceae bacterium]
MALVINSKLPQSGISVFARMTAAANQHEAINLAQGFPNFSPPSALFEFLSEAVHKGMNQYAAMPGLPELRRQLSLRIERDYHAEWNPETEITVTAGATQALYTLISAFIRPGDKALVFEPAYDSYAPAIEVNGGIPVYLRLSLPDFSIPWDALERTLKTERIKLILINNPHNPSGRILQREDLERLERLTRDLDTLLVWDEVYDKLVFDGKQHASALHYPGLMERSIVVFSLGKTLHNTGWKVGYTLARPAITAEIRKLHQFTVFSVNTPAQYAICRFMETAPDFFNDLPDFYQQKRDFFFNHMQGTRFAFLPCEGSYFALASYASLYDGGDSDFAMKLAAENRVAVIPISAFYHDGFDPGMVRFCFAKTEDTIREAARRLA